MTAKYDPINTAIETHWAAWWDSNAIPTQYENTPQTPPNAAGELVALSVSYGGAGRITISRESDVSSEGGIITVMVTVQKGGGMSRAWAIADQAADVWHQLVAEGLPVDDFTVLWLDTPRTIKAGPRDDYVQLNVQAPFELRR